MIGLACSILGHKKSRTAATVLGIAFSFFLTAAQVGLLVGWCNTTSALIRHADADVWLMARQTPAFDYGTAIPRNRIYQARGAEGVAWAQGLFMAWNTWQRPDGRRVNVELIGLDDDLVGGPWRLGAGTLETVRRPDTVVVDDLYLKPLGVEGVGDEVEMTGRRARVGAVSADVRTFTASPFVFASIPAAIKYDRRYRDDEVTYVLARCAPGYSPERVRDAIAAEVPNVEVLTSHQFAVRTVRYWMLETGVGITVVVTAILGLVVGTVIVSQTLFAITQDHLADYGTLLAIGFSRRRLAGVVAAQSGMLGTAGIAVGAALFFAAARASATTPIPLETTRPIFLGLVGVSLICCLLASFLSIRSVFGIDPVSVFKA